MKCEEREGGRKGRGCGKTNAVRLTEDKAATDEEEKLCFGEIRIFFPTYASRVWGMTKHRISANVIITNIWRWARW